MRIPKELSQRKETQKQRTEPRRSYHLRRGQRRIGKKITKGNIVRFGRNTEFHKMREKECLVDQK